MKKNTSSYEFFNPNTLNATMLSIPRDTRVPIVCTKYKSKNDFKIGYVRFRFCSNLES